MTVKELIEKLQEMPQDMEVVNASNSMEVDSVEEVGNYCVCEKEKNVILIC